MVILAGYMEWILTPAETNGHYRMLETAHGEANGVLHFRDRHRRPPGSGELSSNHSHRSDNRRSRGNRLNTVLNLRHCAASPVS